MVRVLIDEDIDVGLRHHLGENVHVETVRYRGWKGIKNGELLGLAEKRFDVFVTMDDNLPDHHRPLGNREAVGRHMTNVAGPAGSPTMKRRGAVMWGILFTLGIAFGWAGLEAQEVESIDVRLQRFLEFGPSASPFASVFRDCAANAPEIDAVFRSAETGAWPYMHRQLLVGYLAGLTRSRCSATAVDEFLRGVIRSEVSGGAQEWTLLTGRAREGLALRRSEANRAFFREMATDPGLPNEIRSGAAFELAPHDEVEARIAAFSELLTSGRMPPGYASFMGPKLARERPDVFLSLLEAHLPGMQGDLSGRALVHVIGEVFSSEVSRWDRTSHRQAAIRVLRMTEERWSDPEARVAVARAIERLTNRR